MIKQKSILSFILVMVMCLGLAVPAWAEDIADDQEIVETVFNEENMVLSDCYNNSYYDKAGNLVTEEIKVYKVADEWEIKETTQVITEMNNGIMPYASGTVTKNKTVEVERAKEKVYRVYTWGKFGYYGSKASVLDASWNTRILSDSVYEEQAPYGGSGVNILGTASIWVNYNLGDSDGTWKGTVELTCNKNGN